MQQYELGGVKFIIHEGELYVRQDPLNGVKAALPEDDSEQPPAAKPKATKKKLGRAPSKCSICGQPGHRRETCPQVKGFEGEVDAALASKNAAIITNRQKVARMVRDGASEAEMYAAMHDFMTDAEFREALQIARREF